MIKIFSYNTVIFNNNNINNNHTSFGSLSEDMLFIHLTKKNIEIDFSRMYLCFLVVFFCVASHNVSLCI